jgi:uncharacterized protein (TIGR02145 family)
MRHLFLLIFLGLICSIGHSQPPALIPYQAIARDAAGNAVLNQNIGLRFSIHDQTITGTVVWQEAQAVLSSPLGVVVTSLGSASDLSAVNWANGDKFLQVEMDITGGTSYSDMGTQQMMSVPYALYAKQSQIALNGIAGISANGDTLYLANGNFIILPGLSVANQGQTGNDIFQPGNGVTDADGNSYPTIIINGEEIMAKNLAVTHFCNGQEIPNVIGNQNWGNTDSAAWCYYNDDQAYNPIYGKLYNEWAAIDDRNICPCGWHVPSEIEWQELVDYLGTLYAGGKMKQIGTVETGTGLWWSDNSYANNESGFSALPGSFRGNGNGEFWFLHRNAYFGSSTLILSTGAPVTKTIDLSHGEGSVSFRISDPSLGVSIRCFRD